MSGYFTYNGVSTATYGIYITGDATYNVANRNLDLQSVVGRSGDVVVDGGNYPNVEVTYHCGLEDPEGINEKLEEFAAALMTATGYRELVDTYHPGVYRLGVVVNPIKVTPYRPNGGLQHRAASFDVVFSCKPQKYLESGDEIVTLQSSGSIHNPTAYPASPILTITGKGTLTVAGQQITIGSDCPENEVTVECELMDAYGGTQLLNKYVTLPLNDITLAAGDNSIQLGSGISGVSIKPRWWTL